MIDKQYKNISEVSEQLKLNKHVIRYWDSKFEGLSTRLSNKKRRFFSNSNIKKLQELKNLLYQNGKHNYSLELANKIISSKSNLDNNSPKKPAEKKDFNIQKLEEISESLKKLIK